MVPSGEISCNSRGRYGVTTSDFWVTSRHGNVLWITSPLCGTGTEGIWRGIGVSFFLAWASCQWNSRVADDVRLHVWCFVMRQFKSFSFPARNNAISYKTHSYISRVLPIISEMFSAVSTSVFLAVPHVPCGPDTCHVVQMNGNPGCAWAWLFSAMWPEGRFKHVCELLNLRTLKFHLRIKYTSPYEISKGTSEVPCNIYYPCIDKNMFFLII